MTRFRQRSVAELLKKTQKISSPRDTETRKGADKIQGPLDESISHLDSTALQICRNCRSCLDANVLQHCSICKLGYHEFCLEDSINGTKCCYDCQQQTTCLRFPQDTVAAGIEETPEKKLEEQIDKCRSGDAVPNSDGVGTSNEHLDVAATNRKDDSPNKQNEDPDYLVTHVLHKPSKACAAQKPGICRRKIFEEAAQDNASGIDTTRLNDDKSCMDSDCIASIDTHKEEKDQEKLTEDNDHASNNGSLVHLKKIETLVEDCKTIDKTLETMGTSNKMSASGKQSDGVELAAGTDLHQLHKTGSEIGTLIQTETKDAVQGDVLDSLVQENEAKPLIGVLSNAHPMQDADGTLHDVTDNIPTASSTAIIKEGAGNQSSVGLVSSPKVESLDEKQVVTKEESVEKCCGPDVPEEKKDRESDSSEDDAKVCDICGDVGYEDMLAICSDCGGAEHVYCYQSLTGQVPEGYWQCEICKAKQRVSGVRQATDLKVTSSLTARLPSFNIPKKVNNAGNARSRLSALLQKRRLPPERKRALKGVPPPLSAKRRAVDDVIEASASKKQALEVLNPPITSSPKINLFREGSFKTPETGKVKFVSYSTLTGAGNEASGGSKVSLTAGHPSSPLGPVTVQSGKARVLTASNSMGSGTARVNVNAQTPVGILTSSSAMKPNSVKMNNDAVLHPSKSFILKAQANLKSSKGASDIAGSEGLTPKDILPGQSSRLFVKANSFRLPKAPADLKSRHEGDPDVPKLKSVNSDLGLPKLIENKPDHLGLTSNVSGKIKPAVGEVVSSSKDLHANTFLNNSEKSAKQEVTTCNLQNRNLPVRSDAMSLGSGKSETLASQYGSDLNDGPKRLEVCDDKRGSIQASSLSRIASKVLEKAAVDTMVLKANTDGGPLVAPAGNTDNSLKESPSMTMEKRRAPGDIGEASGVDLATLALPDIPTTQDEARNNVTSKTRALGVRGSASVVPSLGCTRCYKCKELGHSSKNCNSRNPVPAISTDATNATKSIISTSEVDTASLPQAPQTNMIALNIAQGVDSKKENHSTTVQPLSNSVHASNGSQCAVIITNAGSQVVSFPSPDLQAPPVSTTGMNNSVRPLPVAAFNNMGMKSTTAYDVRYQESRKVQPEAQIIWQGTFDVSGRARVQVSYYGLQANLSNRALLKVREVARKLPASLSLEELPRGSEHNSWPIQFQKSPPINDNIALYFFASGKESYVQQYKPLVDRMIKFDLVLKGLLEDAEILIFPSTLLPHGSQCWQNFMFLWAVFRDRKIPVKQPEARTIIASPAFEVTTIVQSQSMNAVSPSPNGGVILDSSQHLAQKPTAVVKLGQEDGKSTEFMASTVDKEVDMLVKRDVEKPSQSLCSQDASQKVEPGDNGKLTQHIANQSEAPGQSTPALISSASQMNEQSESVSHKLARSSTLSPTRNQERGVQESVNDKDRDVDRIESGRGVSRDREKDRIREKEKQRDKDRERDRPRKLMEAVKERDRYKERDRERDKERDREKERVRDRDRERDREREKWRDKEDRDRRMRDMDRDRDKGDREKARERTRDRDPEKDRTSGRDRMSRYRHRDTVDSRGYRHLHRYACSRSRSRSRTPSNRDWSPSQLQAERYHSRYNRSFRYSRSYSQSPDSDNGFRFLQTRAGSRELSKDSFAQKGKSPEVGDNNRTRRDAMKRRMDTNDSTAEDQGNFSQRGSNSDSLCREATVASKERKLPVTDLNLSPELDDNEEDDMVTSREVVMPFNNQEEKRSYQNFFPANIVGKSRAETGECSNTAGGIFGHHEHFDMMVTDEGNDCLSHNIVNRSMKQAMNPFHVSSQPTSSCLQFFPTSLDDTSNAPDLNLELRVKTVDCPYRQMQAASSMQRLDSDTSLLPISDVYSVSENADLSLSLAVPQHSKKPTVNTSLRLFG